MANPNVNRIRVCQLQSGDIMHGTKEKVQTVILAGINIPSNKAKVYLEKNGNRRCALWGKNTIVGVEVCGG